MHLKLLVKIAELPEREHWEQVVSPRLTGDEEVIESAPHDVKVDILGRAALVFPIQCHEHFGLVMIESMACGTPVIARPQGASTEVVHDGVTGFDADEVEGMAQRIDDLDRIHPELCRRRVAAPFSAEAMLSGYERIFEAEAVAAEATSLRLSGI
ncbi:MAG: glycosyltransferase [Actinomycetota bacterium]